MQQRAELPLLMQKHRCPDLKMLHNLQQAVAAVKRNLDFIFQEKLLFAEGLFFHIRPSCQHRKRFNVYTSAEGLKVHWMNIYLSYEIRT